MISAKGKLLPESSTLGANEMICPCTIYMISKQSYHEVFEKFKDELSQCTQEQAGMVFAGPDAKVAEDCALLLGDFNRNMYAGAPARARLPPLLRCLVTVLPTLKVPPIRHRRTSVGSCRAADLRREP
jgi:hypothetical protein